MGELFRHSRIPSVEMARVDISTKDADRYLLERGDLMFARRSLTLEGAGRCSIMHNVPEPTTWEGSIIRARLDPSLGDPDYYFYFFQSPAGRRSIQAIVEQVAAAGIRSSELGRLIVPRPEMIEQRAIAEVLGALDDKIATNTSLIRATEALSAAVFASLSEGTERLPLTALAQFINGKAFTRDASGTGRVVVRIAELNSGIGGSTVFSDAAVSDQHLARPGDILFAWSGSLTLHRWFRPEAIINQHIFKVIPAKDRPSWLVWGLIAQKLDEFKAIAADKATTMGHIQRRHLEEPVEVPIEAAITRHDEQMSALWNRSLSAEQEILTLAATRDALLPALMSGRLHVRDAEGLVESVV